MSVKPFGKLPSGARLARIKQSGNYRDGSFQNLAETVMIAEGTNYLKLMMNFVGKGPERNPVGVLPSKRTNLKSISGDDTTIIWFGHSSYFIRTQGKNILVDPVFSKRASPFQFLGVKEYPVSIRYTAEDIPTIDALIITHDHYDHLDYNSLISLGPKVKAIYTALGVGSHLSYWGFEEARIKEMDWWEGDTILSGIDLIATPARHFSGRSLVRNKTHWASFILKTGEHNLFLGGDSGYDAAFKTIGEKYGPFDIGILECGQYNTMWPNIHMMPEETVQASADLRAKVLLPVHWGKFTLSLHPWREPIERALKHAQSMNMTLATPMIGEPLSLNQIPPQTHWWNALPVGN